MSLVVCVVSCALWQVAPAYIRLFTHAHCQHCHLPLACTPPVLSLVGLDSSALCLCCWTCEYHPLRTWRMSEVSPSSHLLFYSIYFNNTPLQNECAEGHKRWLHGLHYLIHHFPNPFAPDYNELLEKVRERLCRCINSLRC